MVCDDNLICLSIGACINLLMPGLLKPYVYQTDEILSISFDLVVETMC